MKFLYTLVRLSRQLESALLAFLVSGLLLLSVMQITLRNVNDSGFIWADSLLRIMVLWLALVGAMVATRQGGHININLLGHLLRGSGKLLLSAINELFSGVICALLAYYSYQFVLFEKQDGMIAFLSYPAWWFESIMPFAFAVISLRFFSCALLRWNGKCPEIKTP